jgi:gliding motility-associated-like protein
MIFDRWGQVVFRSIGYPQPWDGTREGTPVPAGTYYYTIELNDPQVQLEAITGYISVVR